MLGSALFPDPQTRLEAIKESGAEIVTVAIRRIDLERENVGILQDLKDYFLLPNTSGCFTAKEALLVAELAREALQTNWIKLEVIGDEKTLYPDSQELLKAAELLTKRGFIVLPYCTSDLILCIKLQDLGCSAIMPLASPIGSGMGILNAYELEILRERISLPLIIDAGLGTASDVAIAMEMGMDGVLVNSAIARARNPVQMARAMRLACEAGRAACSAGRISKKRYAQHTSPMLGVVR